MTTKLQPNKPISGLLDDPEMVKLVEHIKFDGDKPKTQLHRYLALKVYKMHNELHWREQPKYWAFLAQVNEEDLPKTKRQADIMIEKASKPDEKAMEVRNLIRQPLRLDKNALKVKKSRWKKQMQSSKIYSYYDFQRLVKHYMTTGKMPSEECIYNLEIAQVYAEITRLQDKLITIPLD